LSRAQVDRPHIFVMAWDLESNSCQLREPVIQETKALSSFLQKPVDDIPRVRFIPALGWRTFRRRIVSRDQRPTQIVHDTTVVGCRTEA
jgi:hypothetical protein